MISNKEEICKFSGYCQALGVACQEKDYTKCFFYKLRMSRLQEVNR